MVITISRIKPDCHEIWFKFISIMTVIRNEQAKRGLKEITPNWGPIYGDPMYYNTPLFGLLDMDPDFEDTKSPLVCRVAFHQTIQFGREEHHTVVEGMTKLLSLIKGDHPNAKIAVVEDSVFIGLTYNIGYHKLFQIYKILLHHASSYIAVK
jgi:hypothetical protein